MRILVMDDDPEICEVLQEFLTLNGHQVFLAASGTDALEVLEAQTVDAALLDWHVPGLSGRDLVQQVVEKAPEAALFVFTGVAQSGLTEKQAGPVRAVLRKPLSLRELLRLLDESVSGKST